jgi:Glycosyl hydrolases family 39
MNVPPPSWELGSIAANVVTRSHLRYGVNELTGWRGFALGKHSETIRNRLRAIDTKIIRIYAFDRYTPDPVRDWPNFAQYVQAVLDAGAVPMITLTRFRPPFEDAATARWFAQRCGDLAWSCIEQWGGEAVREWYWCVWNEPNSDWINPGFTFDQYRQIYVEVANEILRWLGRYLGDRRALIGGPAIDTFQPFWTDWLWRFVHEVDNSLIGFVLWHRFGDWRAPGEWGAPRDRSVYRNLLMMRTYDYFEQAATIRQLIAARGILNICGKLNVNSHQELGVSGEVNQGVFGAVYYTLALVQLIRGGADAELYWMGTDGAGPHGLWDDCGRPSPVFLAKQMVVQAIRPNDEILIDELDIDRDALIVLRAKNAGGSNAVIVHLSEFSRSYRVADLLGKNQGYAAMRKIDAGTESRSVTVAGDATISFDGPGLAIATIPEQRRN